MLSVSKLERQRTSGPQKRTKSDFIYCAQCYRPRSRKLDLPLSANVFKGHTLFTYSCAMAMFFDVFFSSISLITLIFFFIDEKITWYESIILLGIYASYVIFMKFNQVLSPPTIKPSPFLKAEWEPRS